MPYSLHILGHAERDLKRARKSRPKIAPLLFDACRKLAEDPRPLGCEPVQRYKGLLWRITLKDYKPTYRIIYAIRDRVRAVIICAVRPRDEKTYKNVPVNDLKKYLDQLDRMCDGLD